jgi:UDP-N-acetyl-D-glucosamine dehydrogenase
LDIIEGLQQKGVSVRFYDPLFAYVRIGEINLEREKLTVEALRRYDCLILVTDHSRVNYEFIQKNSKLIFDTRNVYKQSVSNVVRL